MNRDELRAKGFVEQADGTWHKQKSPHPLPFYSVETSCPKPVEARPLDEGKEKRGRSKVGMVKCRVRLTAFRKRLLDPDAVAFACKPLTDTIADSLGIDDADPRVAWEWSQVQTRGVEGVVVTIEAL